jgi:DNA-binding NtrC family response regulator
MTPPERPCLLVVDDEPEVCNSVYHLMRRRYDVLRAGGAAEAIELMKRYDVQIIMTDQRMPDVTGVEMLAQIRSQHPEAIRILFTGYSDINSVIDAVNQGHVYRFLNKPWQPEDLEDALDDAEAEYARIVQRSEAMKEWQEHAQQVEADLHTIRARLAQLEQENEQLRAKLRDRS